MPDDIEASDLTKSQQLIWAGQQLDPHAPLYNMAFAFWIDGDVDSEVFRTAFARLVSQEDVLRTVIELRDSTPRRRVLAELPFRLPIIDVADEESPEIAARRWMQHRCELDFDLAECLFDSALLRLAPDRWVFFFCQHHVVCDAWSFSLLFRQLDAHYQSLLRNDPAPAPLGAFESYACFEREARERAAPNSYWEELTNNAPSPPRLYGVDAREVSSRSDRVSVVLGAQRQKRLVALAGREDFRALTQDLGLFQLFATVLFAWMARVGGQRELAIAAPTHNRVSPALRATAGLLTEVFPLLAEVEEDDTFRALHTKVRVATSSFLKFVSPGASDSRHARSCNVVLNFLRNTFGPLAGHPVNAEWLHPGHHDREHLIRLHVHDFAGRDNWQLQFDLNRDVFGDERANRAAGHFVCLLDAFLDDPDREIADVGLLSPSEWDEIRAFNATSVPAPRTTVLDGIEAMAAASPDAIAVTCGQRALTYHELDQQGASIAAQLQSYHVSPGDRVGILGRRSLEVVAMILGTMKAGAAYVPIDPAWPEQRIAFVAQDAGLTVVLADPGYREVLPEGVRALTPTLQPVSDVADLRGCRPGLGDCAYVMYTSGSTGKPKGVMIEHSALAHYVGWACSKYVQGDRLAFPLFSPLTFDLTVTSLFVPLTTGGTIIVYPETGDQADFALLDVVEENRVDIIKLTPSHLRLLEYRNPRASRVRQLILGGESLTKDAVARISQIFGDDVIVHNEYGPTEATVGCIAHSFRAGDLHDAVAPIGRPIDNMRAWVLDAAGMPVPDGAVGELCVGGAGLAVGYLGRPDLTAERFVVSNVDPSGRVYRTGDLARRNRAGVLEYLGRNDLQLKIRGGRVEPGEIEAALAEHSKIKSCVVAAVRREEGSKPAPIYCVHCGLPSTFPDAEFDESSVCSICRSFEGYGERARGYFRTLEDLRRVFDERPAEHDYDCLALLSGGKDSTYMLCRLVDLGLRVYAFTLDNGYISEQAKANIRRVVEHLGVPHEFATTPAMNQIFVDSLERHANVCQGCFKTIYTLAIQSARQHGIPFIVTGLSRGQLFETRLTEELWTDPELDPERIDDTVLQARKAYHRVDDAVSRLLNTAALQDDAIFEQVRILDFYRYTDVQLDEMLDYLRQRVPWVRPSDTGRSTNCLINDAGIFVHKRERGYHNYALPYSWDVRLGHKTRDAALTELDDEIDAGRVETILDEIGYRKAGEMNDLRLVAYYEAGKEVAQAELVDHLTSRLPAFLIPSHFIRLEAIPLTRNGKVDRDALPDPETYRHLVDEAYIAPRSVVERTLADLWMDALRLDRVGIRDDFFKLGGDSVLAIQIVARAHRAGLRLSPADLFEAPTVERLAARCDTAGALAAGRFDGPVPLTPAQASFLAPLASGSSHWNLLMHLALAEPVAVSSLRRSLRYLVERHDALRLSFVRRDGQWSAHCSDCAEVPALHLTGSLDLARAEIDREFDLAKAPLLRVAVRADHDQASELLVIVHHLIADAVSCALLLDDLAAALRNLEAGKEPAPSPALTSLARCGEALVGDASASKASSELPYWRSMLDAPVAPLPIQPSGPADLVARDQTVTVRLDDGTSKTLLEEVSSSGRIHVQEVLLSALCRTLAEWSGDRAVRFWLQEDGRKAIGEDLSGARTAGWFASIFPLTIELPSSDDTDQLLRKVKEQLRAVPRRGVGYGVLRNASVGHGNGHELAGHEDIEVLFNYMGDTDSLLCAGGAFQPTAPLELSRGPESPRRFAVEIKVTICERQLVLHWTFSPVRVAVVEARARAQRFADHLRELIRHCGTSPVAVSASDFPLAGLDEAKLQKVTAALQRLDADT